jgi:hypothetical protein
MPESIYLDRVPLLTDETLDKREFRMALCRQWTHEQNL